MLLAAFLVQPHPPALAAGVIILADTAPGQWKTALALHRPGEGAAVDRAEDRLSLAESQVAAIRLALLSKLLVITGGPGVGKTTIVNSILRILAAKGVSLLLCAPTGRAAVIFGRRAGI